MTHQKLPKWFKQEPISLESLNVLKTLNGIHTVCEEAQCPNIGHCTNHRTATFMILGNICTRHCTFCAVTKGIPLPLDPNETENVAISAKKLGLEYAVITSVTRDDLPDKGASSFKNVIGALHERNIKAEVLIPDLLGDLDSLDIILKSNPEVLAHNIETIPSLYYEIRPKADYQRSLFILKETKKRNPKIITKTSLMLGLGETIDEITTVLHDLKNINCDIVTFGQYLQPSDNHREVSKYLSPEEFDIIANVAKKIGFRGVVSEPKARSSYEAKALFESLQK